MHLMPAEPRPTGPGRGRRAAVRPLLLAAVTALAVVTASTGTGTERASAGHTRLDSDVRYLGPGGPTLDVHRPIVSAGRAPAVLVVHGGAWNGGDKLALTNASRSLAAAGFVAVNVNYTLATPGRPGYPRQVDELRAAVRWVRRRARSLGVDPRRIGALGSSAGAHLISLLATTGRGPLTRGSRLGAVVAWSPPTDLARLRQRYLRVRIAGFLGCRLCARRSAAASPLTHVTPDDPPMMIVNSRRELIPTSQARRMAGRLRAAGVPSRLWVLPGTLHAPRYSPTTLGPAVRFLSRRLR